MAFCKCDNCDWIGDTDDLDVIKDYHERVAPGEPEPAGECPECGCLAHETDPASLLLENFLLDDSDAGFNHFFVEGEERENGDLDAAYVFAINTALERDRAANAPVASMTPVQAARQAVECLRRARDLLVYAEAPRAAVRVRSAILSTTDAVHHAENREKGFTEGLSFSAWQAARANCADTGLQVGDDASGISGFVYPGACVIERFDDAECALTIGNLQWSGADLERLERILWAVHYLAEFPRILTGTDIETYANGYSSSLNFDAMPDGFLAALKSAETWGFGLHSAAARAAAVRFLATPKNPVTEALEIAERALVAAYGEPVAGASLQSSLGVEAIAAVRKALSERISANVR